MNRVSIRTLVVSVAAALLVGGFLGFFLGMASTRAGLRFLEKLAESEERADISAPQKNIRERFELRYPANWRIDTEDEDYDPDQMFSIDSPGATYVMFLMDDVQSDPEESLGDQVEAFTRLLGAPAIEPFETYGRYSGRGAILRGKVLGIPTTVKAFACYTQGMTAIIVQQYPDEDYRFVKDGLRLIEESFRLRTPPPKRPPDDGSSG